MTGLACRHAEHVREISADLQIAMIAVASAGGLFSRVAA